MGLRKQHALRIFFVRDTLFSLILPFGEGYNDSCLGSSEVRGNDFFLREGFFADGLEEADTVEVIRKEEKLRAAGSERKAFESSFRQVFLRVT